jgi:uncharacterized RDD family membrane protein YckC
MSDSPQYPPPEGSTPPPTTEQPAAPAGGSYGTQPGYGPPPPPPSGGYTPYPTGGDTGPVSGAGQPADLFPRFLARAIDNILLGIVTFLINQVIIRSIFDVNNTNMSVESTLGKVYVASAISGVISGALALAYFGLLESRKGQTLGKMALGLRTQGPDGGLPTLEQAIRRNFWEALSVLAVIPFVGGLIGELATLVIVIVIAVTVGNSQVKQGWHDRFAGGTRVLKTR